MKKNILLAALTLTSMLAASAAFAGEDTQQKIRWQVGEAIDTVDSTITYNSESFSILGQIGEGLYKRDDEGTVVLGLASDVVVSDDGLVWTFTIRDDALWSNGDPIRAQDFEFAWKRLADPETAAAYQWFIENACLKNASEVTSGEADVSELGVKALDDRTLELELSVPSSILESLLVYPPFFPIQQEFYEAAGDAYATSADTLLYSGAFALTDYEPSAVVVRAAKNENYYEADQVKLEEIEWRVILDAQTAALTYSSGELDYARLTGNLIDQYSDDPQFQAVADGYEWYICTNFQDAALANRNIRLALAKSFNKEIITNNVLKDGSFPADFVIPRGLAVSSAGTDFRDDAPAEYENFLYDPAAAKEYWDEGLSELGTDSLTLELLTEDSDSAQEVAQYIQSEWQNNLPGLTIELKVVPKKARLEAQVEGSYQLSLNRWGPDYADPMTYLANWETTAYSNYCHYSSDAYDEIILSAQSGELTYDTDARWEALIEAEGILAEDVALLPVYDQSTASLTRSNIKGLAFYSLYPNYSLIHAYVEE